MAINWVDFLNAPRAKSGIADILPNVLEGYKAARTPGVMDREAKLAEMQAALAEAKTANEKKFGGLTHLSGIPREMQSLQVLEGMYGKDHPLVLDARKRLDSQLKHQEASTAQMQSLVDFAGKRYSTPAGKAGIEEHEIDQGYLPGTMGQKTGPFAQIKLSGTEQERKKGQATLRTLKQTTDDFTRRGLEQAINIHKVRDRINVDDLVRYSGLKGLAMKGIESAKGQVGKDSEAYKRYQESATAAKSMAKQIRQLLKDSISSEANEALNELTNPSAWNISPDAAKRKFNAYMQILDDEINTFYDAARDARVFYGEQTPTTNPAESDLSKEIKKAQEKIGLKVGNIEYTEKDIESTAKRKGLTVEKVKELLRKQNG